MQEICKVYYEKRQAIIGIVKWLSNILKSKMLQHQIGDEP